MTRTQRQPTELEEALLDQLRFLQSSARAFDDGDIAESLRLASTLRLLCHHNPVRGSQALLAQLGLIYPGTTRGLHLLDSGALPLPPGTIAGGQFKLCALRVKAGPGNGLVGFVPTLDARRGITSRFVCFDDWWKDVVVETPAGDRFSRNQLVLVMANQDGGSHFDSRLDEHYHRLTRGGGMGWQVDQTDSGATRISLEIDVRTRRPTATPGDPRLNPAPATVRQVAHELLESLRGRYRKAIKYQPVTSLQPLLGNDGLVELG